MPTNNSNNDDRNNLMDNLVRGSHDFTIIDKDFVLKMKPAMRVEKYVSLIEELIVEGQTEDALNLLRILKNPNMMVMRGVLAQVGGLTSTHRMEQMMRTELEKEMNETHSSGTLQHAMDIYSVVMTNLTWKEKLNLLTQRTSVSIVNENAIRRKKGTKYSVVATRYIPSYVIQCIDEEKNREGRWKFPECNIGIDVSLTSGGLAISPKVFVVHPRPYEHPFVFSSSQKMCLGAGGRKSIRDKMNRTSSTYRIIKSLLDKGEQILRSGYNKPKRQITPANKHIWDTKYRNLKIDNSVTDEYKEMIKAYKKVQKKVKRRKKS